MRNQTMQLNAIGSIQSTTFINRRKTNHRKSMRLYFCDYKWRTKHIHPSLTNYANKCYKCFTKYEVLRGGCTHWIGSGSAVVQYAVPSLTKVSRTGLRASKCVARGLKFQLEICLLASLLEYWTVHMRRVLNIWKMNPDIWRGVEILCPRANIFHIFQSYETYMALHTARK